MHLNPFDIAFGWLWGVIIGSVYFGGRWWTIRQLPHQQKPRLWLAGSFLIRVGVILLLCYFVTLGPKWSVLPRMVSAVIGLVSTRFVSTWAFGHELSKGKPHRQNASMG